MLLFISQGAELANVGNFYAACFTRSGYFLNNPHVPLCFTWGYKYAVRSADSRIDLIIERWAGWRDGDEAHKKEVLDVLASFKPLEPKP